MKNLFLTSAMVLIVSCSHTPESEVIVCTSPNNDPNLTMRFHTDAVSVARRDEHYSVYVINTIDGKQIVINSPEMNKYNCGS